MSNIRSTVSRLAESLLLVGIREEPLLELVAASSVGTHAPRARIWSEGTALEHLLFVLKGEVHVTRLRVNLKTLGEGAFVGAAHVFGGTATDTTLLAGSGGAVLLHIPHAAINALADEYPFVLRRTIAMLGDTLRDVTHERLVREVDAERLIESHLRERAAADGCAPCRAADLAAHLAMNVRYIRRVLKHLERAGRIVVDRRTGTATLTRSRPTERADGPVWKALGVDD